MLKRVISGGQTGADIAGLDVAKKFGFETGGLMPFGFLTLAGCKPEYKELYGLQAHSSSSYRPRTRANVKASSGTIRLAYNFESAGEKCTLTAIKDYKKPSIDVDLVNPIPVDDVIRWLEDNKIQILNVAGNSEETSPGTYTAVSQYLEKVFEKLKKE